MRAERTLPLMTWYLLRDLANAYAHAPLLRGLEPKLFCVGCGFKHLEDYKDCVWLKDIG